MEKLKKFINEVYRFFHKESWGTLSISLAIACLMLSVVSFLSMNPSVMFLTLVAAAGFLRAHIVESRK